MDQVVQPYISVDINPQALQGLCEQLSQTLFDLGICVERSQNELHVSLAYVMGSCEKSVLAAIAGKIAQNKLQAKVCGVEVLEGQTTGYDYVALSFESENAFANVSREISEQLTTKKFDGGFRSHLTLFRIKKGNLKKESVRSVCASLSKKCCETTVAAHSVSVFNSQYEKQLSVAL